MSRRLLHLDAFSGAAGNMFMGAMLDLGLARPRLLEGLAPLGLDFKLVVRTVHRSGLAARHVDVVVPLEKSAKAKNTKQAKGTKKVGPVSRSRASRAGAGRSAFHSHADAAHLLSDAAAHAEAHARGIAHDHVHPGAPEHFRGPVRRYTEIHRLIARAQLAPRVKQRALAIFEALGRAEARVHGIALEKVHFHEVGAVDAIVDVTAAALALELLAIDRVTCSPVAIGHGMVDVAHGRLPLPAPATLELLVGLPTVPAPVAWETVTPTGAAILRTLVDEFGAAPPMTIERVGYGAGGDRPGPMPNVLRAVLGQGAGMRGDRVVTLETNLDDFVPEHFDHLMERLFEAGALDVSLQHLQMKKNRPGFLLRVLARPQDRDGLARIVFAESSAIGVRIGEWDRLVLERWGARIATAFGPVRVKCVRGVDGRVEVSPEYDDCKRAAKKHGVALRTLLEQVTAQARSELAS